MGRVLVLGAGYLGGSFASRLAAAGERVVAVRRSLSAPVEGFEHVRGDLTRPDWIALPPGFDAADAVVLTAAPGPGADYGVYTAGARAAARLARRLGAGIVVYTSSTGIYAEREGGLVDEMSPLADDARGRTLREAERILQQEAPCSAAIGRLSGLYGPGRGPVPRYEDAAALAEGGAYFTNRIRLEDAVSALELLHRGRHAGVFNVTDDEPARAIDVARWIAEARGRPLPDELRFERAGGAAPPSRKILNAKLKALGWELRFPTFREGLADLL